MHKGSQENLRMGYKAKIQDPGQSRLKIDLGSNGSSCPGQVEKSTIARESPGWPKSFRLIIE